jgi:hypothetical protein
MHYRGFIHLPHKRDRIVTRRAEMPDLFPYPAARGAMRIEPVRALARRALLS